MPNTIVEI